VLDKQELANLAFLFSTGVCGVWRKRIHSVNSCYTPISSAVADASSGRSAESGGPGC
jgi:hypothetical protein